jgi:hypothetical protein
LLATLWIFTQNWDNHFCCLTGRSPAKIRVGRVTVNTHIIFFGLNKCQKINRLTWVKRNKFLLPNVSFLLSKCHSCYLVQTASFLSKLRAKKVEKLHKSSFYRKFRKWNTGIGFRNRERLFPVLPIIIKKKIKKNK